MDQNRDTQSENKKDESFILMPVAEPLKVSDEGYQLA